MNNDLPVIQASTTDSPDTMPVPDINDLPSLDKPHLVMDETGEVRGYIHVLEN